MTFKISSKTRLKMLESNRVRTRFKTPFATTDETEVKTRLDGKESESEGLSGRETGGFVACRPRADLG
jgi:hypothetical protein